VPADWQGEGRRSADLALDAYIKQHGARAFQSAITGGQYTRPTGLFYGGTMATWSAQTLITIFRQQLPSTVRYLAVLDLHTGLGPIGYGEPLRADHWLHSSGTVDPALRTEIQLQMRKAFYCENPDWQAAVYGRTTDFIYRGCRGLATSSSA
jgi:hypothetical protein